MSDHIKEFWERQGLIHGRSHEASWGDLHMIHLEVETIGKHISPGDVVLDVGCGNGYSTKLQSTRFSLETGFVGVDYSENLIAAAKKEEKGKYPNIHFETGDARALNFPDRFFDVVYTTRVLINLPTWDEQKQAIKECIRVCKADGIVVLSEAFWEPMELLNGMRLMVGLPAITMHDFNRYLRLTTVRSFLIDHGYSYLVDDFSSVYYLGTRFLKQLVMGTDSYLDYDDLLNEEFYKLEKKFSGGGMGIQQAVVIKK